MLGGVLCVTAGCASFDSEVACGASPADVVCAWVESARGEGMGLLGLQVSEPTLERASGNLTFEFQARVTDPMSVLPAPSILTKTVGVILDSRGCPHKYDLESPTQRLHAVRWWWGPDATTAGEDLRFHVDLPGR